MTHTVLLDFYATFLCVVMTYLLGYLIVKKSKLLTEYNIPEPVVGGVLVALLILILRQYASVEVSFDNSMRDPLMLAFFISIGLGAEFASLKKGGGVLIKFLFVVVGLLVAQNIIGISVISALGLEPIIGLLGGSITLSGGHGTGVAWASVFQAEPYMVNSVLEIAMACATFGLVAGGLIGGPVAKYLIKKHNIQTPSAKEFHPDRPYGFEEPERERLITANSFIKSLSLIAIALFIGTMIYEFFRDSSFTLPAFVWCLFVGVILRNTLSALKIHQVFDREVSVIGNVCLSLFLALALMSINLWQLVALAIPMLTLLFAQVVTLVLYVIFVTFRVMGKNYDAVVLSAGHCGFGLGATPTAIANMQAVTQHYGASRLAFIIVPMVGAFFIDIINALVIQGFLFFIG